MKKLILSAVFASVLAVGCSSHNYNSDEVPDISAAELYEKAQIFMADGDYLQAQHFLEAIDSRYPFGLLSEQVQLDLIYVYYKTRQVDMTSAQINRFLRLSPTSEHVDYVLYMKGLTAIQRRSNILQEWVGLDRSQKDPVENIEAMRIFKQLIESFPNSQYAKDARLRMLFIKDELANREYKIASYYYDRGSYLSAIRHCQTVLYSYKDTKVLKDALELMKESYLRLNLTRPAQNTQKVIDASFNS